jgi:hypothetical protein
MIKGFQQWINENEETPGQETTDDIQRLLDLGLIDRFDYVRSNKRIDPIGWIDRLLQELESRHTAEPDIWGKPALNQTPYNTIEFTLSSDMVNMPEEHYNNYEYALLWAEPVTVVVYLGGDSHLELRASYANQDFEEEYGNEEDQYDATWSYDGQTVIHTVDDILTIISEFNDEVDSYTIEDSPNWSHD